MQRLSGYYSNLGSCLSFHLLFEGHSLILGELLTEALGLYLESCCVVLVKHQVNKDIVLVCY